jgi:hypothetical protein
MAFEFPEDQAAADRDEALRLLGLSDSAPTSLPTLPDLPDTAEPKTQGFVVRIGSST